MNALLTLRILGPATLALSLLVPAGAGAETTIRIMPPDRSDFAVGQRVDLRVEATGGAALGAPRGLQVFVDEVEVTAQNLLDPGPGGARGAGGTGATAPGLPPHHAATAAPPHTTNFLLRGYAFRTPGRHRIRARTADGVEQSVTVRVHAWQGAAAGAARARHIIFLLGDGMGAAHRTAARIVSRGMRDGKAIAPLAMDTLEVTGLVMTTSLNAFVTDSSPGMAAYSTGSKSNNNQEGVFPDNTPDPFDNPRVEYIGELLRRVRGPGFRVGIVTTADVTDATPAANAVHTANRNAGAEIAARFFDERATNAVAVLMGGGARFLRPAGEQGGERKDGRDLAAQFAADGYQLVASGSAVRGLLAAPRVPAKLLGLFHPAHLPVAFDKVGAGRYSRELEEPRHRGFTDPPMLDDLTRLALRSLSAAPAGFYLLVEGASIDKQAHTADAERTIWDTIEFDRAVQVALDFARRTNGDADPANDTLVVVAADHETGGLGLIAVGNERFAPQTLGRAVRDYAAVFRFAPAQLLDLVPNYAVDAQGYPVHPDPSRKILLGWAAAPDRHENWLSNRLARDAAVRLPPGPATEGGGTVARAVANPGRDGTGEASDNASVEGVRIPGFEVAGTIENGAVGCAPGACPADTAPDGHVITGHTASDVPLSATGPGALQFTGTYENTDVFIKLLRSAAGSHARQAAPSGRTP